MKTLIGICALTAATCLLSPVASADNVTFALTPTGGYIESGAGTSVGWGFTITNDATDYVVISSFQFEGIDPLLFSFPSPPPEAATQSSPVSRVWSLGASGLQFDIPIDAPFGTSFIGKMILNYDIYKDISLSDWVDANSVYARYNGADVLAEVYTNAPFVVPEPSYQLLLLGIIAAMAARSAHK